MPKGRYNKSGYEYLRERTGRARARERLQTKRLVHLHRPIWLHDRNTTGAPCPCCESLNAVRVQEIDHLDVLFDRETGTRLVRTETNAKEFDVLAAEAHRIECPARCYDKQFPILLDRTHKIIGVFGGTQAGKSAVEAEWFFDQILERGGPGAIFLWVAPDAKQARQIGLGKLVRGERTDRAARPLIPAELIAAWPRGTQLDQPLRLIDGTEIYFKHASETDASNLKGIAAQAVVLDEGCAVRHEVNFDELISRLTTTGGQLLTASTPVLGNFLEHRVYRAGKTYEAIEAGEQTNIAIANLTCFDNPWQSPANVEEFSRSFGTDDLRRKLQVYGEWVVVGTLLWRNWKRDVHTVEGIERDITAYYALENITPIIAAGFFKRSTAHLQFFGGQDFNLCPMNLAVLQVGCPRGLDPNNPQNWILYCNDLVARDSDIVQWSDWLRDIAGDRHGRGLPNDFYKGMAIACDASSGHANRAPSAGGIDPYIQTMTRAGFDCRPCNLTSNGHPQNPPVPARTTMLHRLMADRVDLPNSDVKIPRLLVHGTYAAELGEALGRQTSTPDGRPYKVSNTKSDRISGPIDALAYGAWAVLSDADRPQSRIISNSLFS